MNPSNQARNVAHTQRSLNQLGDGKIQGFLKNRLGNNMSGVIENFALGPDRHHPDYLSTTSNIQTDLVESERKLTPICQKIKTFSDTYDIPLSKVHYYKLNAFPPMPGYSPDAFSQECIIVNCETMTETRIPINNLYGKMFLLILESGEVHVIEKLQEIKHNDNVMTHHNETYMTFNSTYEDTDIFYTRRGYGSDIPSRLVVNGSFEMIEILGQMPAKPLMNRFSNFLTSKVQTRKRKMENNARKNKNNKQNNNKIKNRTKRRKLRASIKKGGRKREHTKKNTKIHKNKKNNKNSKLF